MDPMIGPRERHEAEAIEPTKSPDRPVRTCRGVSETPRRARGVARTADEEVFVDAAFADEVPPGKSTS